VTARQLLFGAFLSAMLWALVIFVALARAERPAGMHLASIVREDTVYLPNRTPSSAWLDSVARVDSLKLERRRK
jgi:hypothetical protein